MVLSTRYRYTVYDAVLTNTELEYITVTAVGRSSVLCPIHGMPNILGTKQDMHEPNELHRKGRYFVLRLPSPVRSVPVLTESTP